MRAQSRRAWPAWMLGLSAGLAIGVGSAPGSARGQYAGAGQGGQTSPLSAGMMSNPFMNPVANPFLNPYMTGQQVSPGTAALYFISANQQNGGIGSGVLSGSRPASGNGGGMMGQTQAGAQLNNLTGGYRRPRPGVGPLSPAEPQKKATSNIPGAGASKYFARQFPSTSEPSRYYARQNRQFPNIGR